MRSSGDRNEAVSGQSKTIHQQARPTRAVAMPSRMKIQDQPARPAMPSILAMAAARRPPKEPASAAEEKNSDERMPISLLLYQHPR